MSFDKLCEFYRGKRILVTGHTGFKGAWLLSMLNYMEANVVGYALKPPTNPSLYDLLNMDKKVKSYIGDICDLECLKKVFKTEMPEIVIHMAAQPIVRESYNDPVGTYETNIMGTVNVLECCRLSDSVKSIVNVTTDKVYRNNEWDKGYVEEDILDGFDPYSNSKSCSELVTHSYVQSFFNTKGVSVSTCRAGNVIGGGDFAKDRIIPDCLRAAENNECIIVRNPNSVRPYQHVLEPLFAYLLIAMEQYKDISLAGCYNIGPDDNNCVTTGDLVDMFCRIWNLKENELSWKCQKDGGPHEANYLKLDCTKVKETFGWAPKWNMEQNLNKIIDLERLRIETGNSSKRADILEKCIAEQIEEYIEMLRY